MRTHRFVIDELLVAGRMTIQTPELVNQWRNVLRFVPGQAMTLTDGRGHEASAKLLDYTAVGAVLDVETVTTANSESVRQVTLYCAVLKKENFELVCQKATEIGVARIVPVVTTRTVKLGLNEERIKKIITEAVEQSGQSMVPELGPITEFGEVLQKTQTDRKIIFHTSDNEKVELSESENMTVAILVGPEGGFTDEEVASAKNTGWEVCSLGDNVLRGETAAIVGSYLAIRGLI